MLLKTGSRSCAEAPGAPAADHRIDFADLVGTGITVYGQQEVVKDLLADRVEIMNTAQRLFHVGRLDADSEGLILLTNDGEFCQKVAHPSHGLLKTYRVTLAKRLETETLKQLTVGLRDKGDFLKARSARLLSANNTRSEAELVLAEGKNREVRRMFKALGLRVLRLQRVAVGPVKLGELPPGKWRMLSRAEVASCLKPRGKSPRPSRRN